MERTIRLSVVLNTEYRLKELCDLLDDGKYWQEFAVHINITPREITKIQNITNHDKDFSPSRDLLLKWQHKQEATVTRFIEILRAINHYHAECLVQTWIKLPVESSNVNNYKNAGNTELEKRSRDDDHDDVKVWLKRARLEPLEHRLSQLGAEKVEDLKLMEHEWVMELANTLKPIPRKRFLSEIGILCSLPTLERKNANDKEIQQKHPGEEEYQQGMTFYWKGNYHEALPFFEKAASLKYPPAFIRLKIIYEKWNDSENSKVVIDQCTEYAPWFVEQIQGGDMNAEYNLALYYSLISKDYKQSFYWWNKMAQRGLSLAQLNLGYCYEYGEGVEKNPSQAVYWYQKAADQGNVRAQLNLGYCYNTGQGVERDPSQAVYWFQKAADQGHANAQYNLGVSYEKGEGIEKNPSQAVYWYQKAAEQENVKAQYNLGVCYMFGQGVEKNPSQAVYWYQKAAEQGYPDAQYNLGVCYYKGIGASQDYEKAAHWYKKGAEQNQLDAMYWYGVALEIGCGVVQNYTEAAVWYKKAADMGYEGAQEALERVTTTTPNKQGKSSKSKDDTCIVS